MPCRSMLRSSRSSAGCASRASVVTPVTGLSCPSRTLTSSTASPAALRTRWPSTRQRRSSCARARATSVSNISPALYELCTSTPPKVDVAAFTMIAFTAKTTPKKATSHTRTARPVSSRGRLAVAIAAPRGWSEKMVTHLRHFDGIDVDQAEQDRSRRRGRRVAVIGNRHAHFARSVRPDVDELLAVRARRQADEVDQRRRNTIDAEDKIAMLELLVDDADCVGIAQRAVGQ